MTFITETLNGRETPHIDPTEVENGVRIAHEWNHTPDPGTPASQYCRCGRTKTPDTDTCQWHRKSRS